jgi:aryl-alcohol dehydrogenase-like predicted oxidoreductase
VAARDEVFVATKGGFLTPDPELVTPGRSAQGALIETYVRTGLVDPERVVAGVHCMDPPFLRDQIARSRRNLRLATIDCWCIEEPELCLAELGTRELRRRLCAAFEALEAAVEAGEIGCYGLATWDGLLRPHSDRVHLSLLDVFDWALDVGGPGHHLRALQLPYNLAMAEALKRPSQIAPAGGEAVLAALRGTGTMVLASAPLAQGRVLGRLPRFVRERLPGLESDAQRSLQFVRSTPGITTAVVGMRDPEHVRENLRLAARAPVDAAVIESLFAAAAAA